ncbi:MAG TPA: branched-chain amino acid ABC transporter permease [Rhodoglobus sp.]|nr:branched-chain amino acid ABC transporter permease [Rhodoglobus sp.]
MAALLAMLAFTASPASADEVDTDKYPNRVSGNVQLNGEPLEGVELNVSGNGVDTDVVTDENGQWAVGVPEKNADYTVTLNEETLPEGIAVVDEEDDSPNEKETTVGPGGRVSVNFFIGEGERNVTGFADQLVQRLITGLRFGLMLALAAVGLSLVFGTTGLSNFAHAEMVTFGAVAALLMSQAGVPIVLAAALAVALGAVFGFVLDAGLWRPLRRRRVGIVQLMIVSIGLSLAVRYVFQYIIGGGTSQLPGADARPIPLFGTVALTPIDMISFGISIVVILAVAGWLLFTRVGKATRAISDNPSLAAASGIDVDGVVRIVWVLAGALAALAGVLYAYYRPGIKWDMGSAFLLLLFAAVTLGGLGTAFGALIGALVIGLIVEVSTLWIPADLKFAAPLVVLIIILLFRPQGILGRRERIG